LENSVGGYNVKQTSYQILVADSPELLQPNKANIWDSGKITSDQSIQVEFDGKTLEATQVYYWKVKFGIIRVAPQLGVKSLLGKWDFSQGIGAMPNGLPTSVWQIVW
jgi:hypothetical protein